MSGWLTGMAWCRCVRPKHGKEDAKNDPHVGGNTWAGGTGGSDTAGLGGRGGPYRLDRGHTVHQVRRGWERERRTGGRWWVELCGAV